VPTLSRLPASRHPRGLRFTVLSPEHRNPWNPAGRFPSIETGGQSRERSSTGPESSVLDPNYKARELDNLYVVDTSFVPSIGAGNPALTARANAIRAGEHLIERLA
jgi:hypothetical protein